MFFHVFEIGLKFISSEIVKFSIILFIDFILIWLCWRKAGGVALRLDGRRAY